MLDPTESFLHQIIVMLPAFHAVEEHLDRETGHKFNVFNLTRTDEPAINRLLGTLLNPKEMHGQSDLFLRLFIDRFVPEWSDTFSYSRAKPASTSELIDVTISDDKHWLSIENKIFDAQEQKQQTDRYLNALKLASGQAGDYRLIYLSSKGNPPSKYSFSEEGKKHHQDKLVIGAWVRPDEATEASKKAVSNSGTANLRRLENCTDWLNECEGRCRADNVRWFLRQFQTLIYKRLLPDEESSMTGNAIVDLALRSTDNLDAALRIGEKCQQIRERVTKSILSDIQRNIERWIEKQSEDWELCINWPRGNWIKTPSSSYLHILLRRPIWPSMVGASLTADGTGPSNIAVGILAPSQKTWEKDKGAEYYGPHDFFIDDNKRQEIATALEMTAPESPWWVKSEVLKDIDGRNISDWRDIETIKRLHATGERLAVEITNKMEELAQTVNTALN